MKVIIDIPENIYKVIKDSDTLYNKEQIFNLYQTLIQAVFDCEELIESECRNMTKEEAIEDLLRHYTGESTDIAIEAIKQSFALDKIRTEIEGYKSTIDNAISEDELKIEGMKEAYADCLKIIDKYKADMRGEEV